MRSQMESWDCQYPDFGCRSTFWKAEEGKPSTENPLNAAHPDTGILVAMYCLSHLIPQKQHVLEERILGTDPATFLLGAKCSWANDCFWASVLLGLNARWSNLVSLSTVASSQIYDMIKFILPHTFDKRGNWGSGMWVNLPKTTQLLGIRVMPTVQIYLILKSVSCVLPTTRPSIPLTIIGNSSKEVHTSLAAGPTVRGAEFQAGPVAEGEDCLPGWASVITFLIHPPQLCRFFNPPRCVTTLSQLLLPVLM